MPVFIMHLNSSRAQRIAIIDKIQSTYPKDQVTIASSVEAQSLLGSNKSYDTLIAEALNAVEYRKKMGGNKHPQDFLGDLIPQTSVAFKGGRHLDRDKVQAVNTLVSQYPAFQAIVDKYKAEPYELSPKDMLQELNAKRGTTIILQGNPSLQWVVDMYSDLPPSYLYQQIISQREIEELIEEKPYLRPLAEKYATTPYAFAPYRLYNELLDYCSIQEHIEKESRDSWKQKMQKVADKYLTAGRNPSDVLLQIVSWGLGSMAYSNAKTGSVEERIIKKYEKRNWTPSAIANVLDDRRNGWTPRI